MTQLLSIQEYEKLFIELTTGVKQTARIARLFQASIFPFIKAVSSRPMRDLRYRSMKDTQMAPVSS
jgi:hypothetical protein